jgi:2-methylcitrate dehydratase PrpD
LSKVVDVQCGFDYRPTNALNAQMSLRYIVAAALLEGQVLPPQFADGKLADPKLVKLAADLELVHDPKLDELYPKNFAGWVGAQAKGELVRVDVLDPSGSPAAPIDARGITEKFRGINAHLPVDRIAETALSIEKHSVKDLLALLV